MPILQIEHGVRGFDDWKRAFDNDPVGRERGGVRAYRVLRPLDDPDYVLVELDFNSLSEAEAFQKELEQLWSRAVEQGLIERPRARIVETVESVEY